MKWFLVALLVLPTIAFANVGSITEKTGNSAGAKREGEQLTVELGFEVEMLDELITADTRLGITFEDDTRVELTEQSELVIDEFVYDPNTNMGKLSVKVALGTVQMTSGNIAHANSDNVNIQTPTASITVRGTDFSMTVDELGRSLIILLPSCPDPTMDEDECPTGAIEVSTDAGTVLLNEPYQGTLVSSGSLMPSDPRKLLLERTNINNNLIIVPPGEFPRGFAAVDEQEEIENILDQDLLEYNELSADFLSEDLLKISELDINKLDTTYLDNMLDINSAELTENDLDEKDGILPTVSRYPWIQSAFNEEQIYIESDRPPHIAEITASIDISGQADIIQDGIKAEIVYNGGGTDVIINVVQLQ
jgi:hypothetical protein